VIKNLTHDEHGNSLQRLPIAIKVSIGLAPDKSKGRNYPSRLDHFQFLKKSQSKDAPGVTWVPDPDVTKAYGESPREVGIILLDDNVDNVFKTEMAWWTANEWKCRGSLVQINGNGHFDMRAVRRTEAHPEGESWPGDRKIPGCGDSCPDLIRGDCGASGDLYFILDKFPMLGAICRIHTKSYRSIRNLSNALSQIQGITGGRLVGIRLMLNVEPEKVSYVDDKGVKKSSTAHILNLRIDSSSMPKLLENMTENQKLFQGMQKLFGGRRVEIEEDETERAAEIAAEFYPDKPSKETRALPADTTRTVNGTVSTVPPAEIPNSDEWISNQKDVADGVGLQADIQKLARELGMNDANFWMLMGKWDNDLPGLKKDLTERLQLKASKGGEPEKAVTSSSNVSREEKREGSKTEPNPPASSKGSTGKLNLKF
jgi:hypothetical protein